MVLLLDIENIVKWGNCCTLKLEKGTKALFMGFFHAICLQRCPMANTALKHKHMASKFNPGVEIMKKSQCNNYLLKKQPFVAHFFSIIAHYFFRLCKNYQMYAIIENALCMTFSITAHSCFVFIYKRNLSEYLINLFTNSRCRSRFPFNI